MSELLPCPLCGGEPEFQHFNILPNVRGRIICSCGLEIRQGANDTEDDLNIIWNTRHVETCQWEYPQGVNGWVGYAVCSSCGERFDECVTDIAHYCPKCGRKVEG